MDLDQRNARGDTPMHLACQGGHLEVAQWLHAAGARVDLPDSHSLQPIHHVCIQLAKWSDQWSTAVEDSELNNLACSRLAVIASSALTPK